MDEERLTDAEGRALAAYALSTSTFAILRGRGLISDADADLIVNAAITNLENFQMARLGDDVLKSAREDLQALVGTRAPRLGPRSS